MTQGKQPTKLTIKVDPKLQALAEEAIFVPHASQKKAKHRFLDKWDGFSELTCERVVSMTGMTKIKKWWSQPGFKDWLTNSESIVAKVNYLTDLALDTAEEVLLDPDAGASARVNMIKVVLGFKHVLEQKQSQQGAFDNLSKEDLIKVIRQKSQQLGPIIDAEET